MTGPLGGTIDRAFRMTRRKDAGFLVLAESLPADEVAAMEAIHEEKAAFLDEKRKRDEAAESIKQELAKAAKYGG